MADLKISQLQAHTSPTDNDLLAIVDIVGGETKKTTINELLTSTAATSVLESTLNKENATIDISTTKYPTVNLLKTGLDAKQPRNIYFGTTTTAAATAAKVVTLDSPFGSYTPQAGDIFVILYSGVAQTAANVTLDINSAGAKNVRLANANANNVGHTTASGGRLMYLYDGTYYHLIGSQLSTNTTYSEITQANIIDSAETTTGLISGRRAEDLMVNEATKTRTLTNKDLTTGNTFPTFNQNTTGNAGTATKLATARNINGVAFDGTANITITDSTKENTITAGTTSQYWRGDKSWQTLDKTAVGLGNVDNTSDATKNSASATLTNKRITKRVSSTTSTATLTPNSDAYDVVKLTAQAAALTIAAPTGTPTDGQPLLIQIVDNGTARALTWNAAFVAMGAALPTTTTISKILQVGCIWNAGTSKWLASSIQQV